MHPKSMKFNARIILFGISVLLVLMCSPERNYNVTLSNLTCEYLENPIGLDMSSPRLSWILNSEGKSIKQSAYQIVAATNQEILQQDSSNLWNTGKISTDQSIQIKYEGKNMKSGMRVFWKVRIWDEDDQPTAWSNVAFWEMSFLRDADWKAKWISTKDFRKGNSYNLRAPYFRKDIDIHKKIKRARVYATGLGYYEFYLNGQKIGDHVLSPNQTNYDKRELEKWGEPRVGNMQTSVLYETFDITSYLKNGKNTAGILLGNGWYIQADRLEEASLWYDTPRTIAQLEIEYEDGGKEIISTDNTWKTSGSPILYNGLHTGEIYDARLEIAGWNRPEFNDSSWENAIEVRPPEGKLKSQISPPDRITKRIAPVKLSMPDTGIYRYDLGQMISGWARLKISGPKGTEIKMRFMEELGPTYGQTDTYILKGDGIETWEPRFTWHAFRYIDVTGAPVELTNENLEGVVVNTDVKEAGSFTSSNKLFNQILQNYQWTQLGNMHGGIPSDCPHRERRGYTGDGQISCVSAIYNFDMAQFYTKWLEDIREAQNSETGYVTNTAPYQDGGGGTAWGAAYIIIPWNMYLYYGDKRILSEHYEGMKHWVSYLKSELDQDGILINQGLGEWVPPEKVEIPPSFVNTCYYYYCTSLMTKIATVLGNEEDGQYYDELSDRTKNVINANFLNKEQSMYSTGRQGADVFPLGFGIVPEQEIQNIFQHLVNHTLDTKIHFDTGILGTPLLLDVLTDLGRIDLAYAMMNQRDFPGFGYMLGNNATTIWETWLGEQSHSHPMFGSVTAWFYKYLAGVQADSEQPGFKHIIIKPQPVFGLIHAKSSYLSPYGNIISDWHFEQDRFILDVTIPHNTRATVYIPTNNTSLIKENGRSISKNENIKLLPNEGQLAVFELGSGNYSFSSPDVKDLLPKPIPQSPNITPGDTLATKGDSVFVQIKTDYPDAKVLYTLNGQEPDSLSSVFDQSFYLSQNTTIKAKTFLNHSEPSFTTTRIINFIDINKNGLSYTYYEGKWSKLPDFDKQQVVQSGKSFQFSLKNIYPKVDEFGIVYSGLINIKEEGNYTFYVASNDGTKLFVNNKLIVENDGPHGAGEEKIGEIRLTIGMHPIRLNYFQAGGGLFLKASYSGPGVEKCEIPALVLMQQ